MTAPEPPFAAIKRRGPVRRGRDCDCDCDKMDKGRYMANYQKGKELAERFQAEFGSAACEDLQRKFTGRTYDMWQPDQYKTFNDARGSKCADATAIVTRWAVEKP